jgi:hypothetical protein
MNKTFEFYGKMLIPGTRKSETFGPIQIKAETAQKASAFLAPVLNQTFRKDLHNKHTFSRDFALVQIPWRMIQVAPPIAIAPAIDNIVSGEVLSL